jgi:DnaJ-class molecular chaperone
MPCRRWAWSLLLRRALGLLQGTAFEKRSSRWIEVDVALPAPDAADYALLGLSPGAGEAAVRRSWRRRARRVHPDSAGGGTADGFIRLRAAYERVRESERRRSGTG